MPRDRDIAGTAAKALLVCATYYAGAHLGFVLTFPTLPTSTFWLPNATMFAVFVLTRPRRWWIYAAAALPAHIAMQLQHGAPTLAMILLFATNLGDGALAALVMRRLARHDQPLQGFRNVAVFLACAIASPFIVSFLDAGVVTAAGWTHDYWMVWHTRFRSNVLTNMIWVPFVVIAATRGLDWLRANRPRRYLEAAVLSGALALVAASVFGVARSKAMTPLLYAPMPLFLWAAARFETGGVSGALLLFAFFVIWNATRGYGPISAASPAENALAVQTSLTLLSAPLLLLGSLFGEQRRAKLALADRESQYRSVFESTSDGILVTDLQHAVAAVNPAFCALTGYGAFDLQMTHPRSFLHLDDLQPLDSYLDAVTANAPVTAQAMCVCADGRLARVELRGTRFSYAGRAHVLSVIRDVTKHEQALRLLEQKVTERTRELSTLLEISSTVASTLELEQLLSVVLAALQSLLGCKGATILVVQGDEISVVDHRGPIPAGDIANARFPARWAFEYAEVRGNSPLVIDDIWDDSAGAKAFRASAPPAMTTLFRHARSLLVVPLRARDRPIGFLLIDSDQPGRYGLREAHLARALANQAAVAIENTRLYDQGRELAALEERQRLARELHDSVTQSLYSASMLGRALPTVWEHDQANARRMLTHLQSVTTSALAEMRTLLNELRPSTVLQSELGDLLHQLARALHSHIEKPIEVVIDGDAALPAEVQVTFYRLAQAALGNVAKHAATAQATVTLRCTPEFATLIIADDGPGFDLNEAAGRGRMGIDIMRERAVAAGAAFDVETAPGRGTRITLRWPDDDGGASLSS